MSSSDDNKESGTVYKDCVFSGDLEPGNVRGLDFLEILSRDIESCLRAGSYSVALTSALTIPDICSKLEDRPFPEVKENKRKQVRYEDWFDHFVAKSYPSKGWPPSNTGGTIAEDDWPPKPGVTGADAYALRNAVVHGADFETPSHQSRPYLDGFTFFAPSDSGHIHRGYHYDQRRAYLNVVIFCEDVLEGLRQWETSIGCKPAVQKRRATLARILEVSAS